MALPVARSRPIVVAVDRLRTGDFDGVYGRDGARRTGALGRFVAKPPVDLDDIENDDDEWRDTTSPAVSRGQRWNGLTERPRACRPATESLEGRVVLSGAGLSPAQAVHNALFGTYGVQASRPNTPVLPFEATTTPSFIDPSVAVLSGLNVAVGTSTLRCPSGEA